MFLQSSLSGGKGLGIGNSLSTSNLNMLQHSDSSSNSSMLSHSKSSVQLPMSNDTPKENPLQALLVQLQQGSAASNNHSSNNSNLSAHHHSMSVPPPSFPVQAAATTPSLNTHHHQQQMMQQLAAPAVAEDVSADNRGNDVILNLVQQLAKMAQQQEQVSHTICCYLSDFHFTTSYFQLLFSEITITSFYPKILMFFGNV